MPIIVTKRAGGCTVCGGRIGKGEYADYTRDEGLKHPEQECAGEPAAQRPNRRPADCTRCGKHLGPGEGQLHHVEKKRRNGRSRGMYAHVFTVTCPQPCAQAPSRSNNRARSR